MALSFISFGLSAFFLAACATPSETAEQWARKGRLVKSVLATDSFDLASWSRQSWDRGHPLIVYIEGDGHAWITPTRISDDPTPQIPLALELASRDQRPNVVYLARPCQYIQGIKSRNCSPAFWTNARFSEPVVRAMSEAVDAYVKRSGAASVQLIGYSGGGAVAALLAARRSDISLLVSVAGVLDHTVWAEELGLTPLYESLNPADFALKLTGIRQVHFVGGKDGEVPSMVAKAFARRVPTEKRPRIVEMPGFDHQCCWVERWPELVATYLKT